MAYVSLLPLLLGVLMLAFVWAAGHKTPLPRIARPELFWIPGIGLLVLALVVLLVPSVLEYNKCASACEATDGVPAGTAWAEEFNGPVADEFAGCVKGSTSYRRAELVRMFETDPTIQVEATIAEEMPDIEWNCRYIVIGRCVNGCYSHEAQ